MNKNPKSRSKKVDQKKSRSNRRMISGGDVNSEHVPILTLVSTKSTFERIVLRVKRSMDTVDVRVVEHDSTRLASLKLSGRVWEGKSWSWAATWILSGNQNLNFRLLRAQKLRRRGARTIRRLAIAHFRWRHHGFWILRFWIPKFRILNHRQELLEDFIVEFRRFSAFFRFFGRWFWWNLGQKVFFSKKNFWKFFYQNFFFLEFFSNKK